MAAGFQPRNHLDIYGDCGIVCEDGGAEGRCSCPNLIEQHPERRYLQLDYRDRIGNRTDYQIRITSTTNPAITDTSNGNFAIISPTANTSTILSLQSEKCYGAETCNPTGNPVGGGAGYTRILHVRYVYGNKPFPA